MSSEQEARQEQTAQQLTRQAVAKKVGALMLAKMALALLVKGGELLLRRIAAVP